MLGWLAHAGGGGSSGSSASLTTTITDEVDVATNQNSIIVIVTNDTLKSFTQAIKQAIIDNLTSAQSEDNGWNNRVRSELQTPSVTRVTSAIYRIDLPPFPALAITATETITVTVPAVALDSATAITVSPTFAVTDVDVGNSLINATATLGPASNYQIDDHSGFKVPTSDKTFQKDGYGIYSTAKYKDTRHPQDLIRSKGDSFRGSDSPEPDDEFSTSSADDLP